MAITCLASTTPSRCTGESGKKKEKKNRQVGHYCTPLFVLHKLHNLSPATPRLRFYDTPTTDDGSARFATRPRPVRGVRRRRRRRFRSKIFHGFYGVPSVGLTRRPSNVCRPVRVRGRLPRAAPRRTTARNRTGRTGETPISSQTRPPLFRGLGGHNASRNVFGVRLFFFFFFKTPFILI